MSAVSCTMVPSGMRITGFMKRWIAGRISLRKVRSVGSFSTYGMPCLRR